MRIARRRRKGDAGGRSVTRAPWPVRRLFGGTRTFVSTAASTAGRGFPSRRPPPPPPPVTVTVTVMMATTATTATAAAAAAQDPAHPSPPVRVVEPRPDKQRRMLLVTVVTEALPRARALLSVVQLPARVERSVQQFEQLYRRLVARHPDRVVPALVSPPAEYVTGRGRTASWQLSADSPLRLAPH